MLLPLLLPSFAATVIAFTYKPAPGGIQPGCADTWPTKFDLIRAAPGVKKRDGVYPYPGQVRHSNLLCPELTLFQQVPLAGLTLKDGILKDKEGRIGSIVANFQFQFDGPEPQASGRRRFKNVY